MKKIFRVIVDYSKSMDEMIKAGNYRWVNSEIPVQGQGKVELNIELIHYGKHMESDDVIQNLDSRGLRPATLSELLALGSDYPKEKRKFTVVALGSVLRRRGGGDRFVAFLDGKKSQRKLDLLFWDGGWGSDYRFAAVRI